MNHSLQKKHLHRFNQAELAIARAMHEIEETTGDPLLSEAILKLIEAQSLIKDFLTNSIKEKPDPGELLQTEKNKVDEQIALLEISLSSPEREITDKSQKIVMYIQLNAMHIYSRCLHQRLVMML